MASRGEELAEAASYQRQPSPMGAASLLDRYGPPHPGLVVRRLPLFSLARLASRRRFATPCSDAESMQANLSPATADHTWRGSFSSPIAWLRSLGGVRLRVRMPSSLVTSSETAWLGIPDPPFRCGVAALTRAAGRLRTIRPKGCGVCFESPGGNAFLGNAV